jgi:hypothetical protein
MMRSILPEQAINVASIIIVYWDCLSVSERQQMVDIVASMYFDRCSAPRSPDNAVSQCVYLTCM